MSYANSIKSIFNANKFIGIKVDENRMDATFSFDLKGNVKDVVIPFSGLSNFIRQPTGTYEIWDVLGGRQIMGKTQRIKGHAEIERGFFVPVSDLVEAETLLRTKTFERVLEL